MTRKKAILTVLGFFFVVVFMLFRYRRKTTTSFALEKDDIALIDAIAERIIPRTATPGAQDALVVNYIISVIDNCYSNREKWIFFTGLDELKKYSLNHFSRSFLLCNIEEKNRILVYFENKNLYAVPLFNKIRKKIIGNTFFEQIKWLTVSGYCNSKLGATRGLRYENVPIVYESCTPYFANQRSWATK